MAQDILGGNAWPIVGLARFYPSAPGQTYSADTLSVGPRTTAQTFQRVVAAPVYTGDGFTVSQWTVHVATATAGAVYRIGVWSVLNPAAPFAWQAGKKFARLLRDVGVQAGTVDCSTVGSKTVNDTATFAPGLWLMIGGVLQGVTGANLTIGTNSSGIATPYGLSAAGSGVNVAGLIGLAQDGVTGALGDLTPSGGSLVGHGVAFTRSA